MARHLDIEGMVAGPATGTVDSLRAGWTLARYRHFRPEYTVDLPMAFFLTFRTYRTWVPGDGRGFVDHRRHGEEPAEFAPDGRLEARSRALMQGPARILTDAQRDCVRESIEAFCVHRGVRLYACNVRTNHVHVVLSAEHSPEQILGSLKAWARRRLREAGLVLPDERIWARHGSTRHLFTENSALAAVDYALNWQ